jgi:Fe-S-cluster containining protein
MLILLDNKPINLELVLQPWYQVAAKADDFFQRVYNRFADNMSCTLGCTDCCKPHLSVMLAEALAILWGMEKLAHGQTNGVSQCQTMVSVPYSRPGCCFLLEGKCSIYPMRPIICRTHGLPLQEGEQWSCCAKNFTSIQPPKDVVLNETLLTAGLTVADALIRQTLHIVKPQRILLNDLFTLGLKALPFPLVASSGAATPTT